MNKGFFGVIVYLLNIYCSENTIILLKSQEKYQFFQNHAFMSIIIHFIRFPKLNLGALDLEGYLRL